MRTFAYHLFGKLPSTLFIALLGVGLITAVAHAAPAQQTDPVWIATYWNNVNLSGEPAEVRAEESIDYAWGRGSPAPAVDDDRFSARWTRTLDLAAGDHQFTLTVDDGARLYVDGQLLIDAWQLQAATTYTADFSAPGRPVNVELQYFENTGIAEVALDWQPITPGPPETPPNPDVITVDNIDIAFRSGGPDGNWETEPEGYGNSLRWTQNSRRATDPYNWGVWYPNLEAGIYQVAVYIPDRFSTTSQARYWVSHANGFNLTEVDQSVNGGEWVTLGTYEFEGTAEDYVSLADVTLEENQTTLIAYDAVRFIRNTGNESQTTLTLSARFVNPGDVLTVTGTGFPPNRQVDLLVGVPNAEPFGQYAEGTTNANGAVTLDFTVPATRPGGEPINRTELAVLLLSSDGTTAVETFDYLD